MKCCYITSQVLTLAAAVLAGGCDARRAPIADPVAPTPGTSWVSQPVGMCHTSHSLTLLLTSGHKRGILDIGRIETTEW